MSTLKMSHFPLFPNEVELPSYYPYWFLTHHFMVDLNLFRKVAIWKLNNYLQKSVQESLC